MERSSMFIERLGGSRVSIFDSVRFLLEKTNQTEFLFFLNSELKPIQTDHFRFGSIRLIKEKNWKNRYYQVMFHMKGMLMPTNGEDR